MQELQIEIKDKKLFARILCEIDHHAAKRLREQIDLAVCQNECEELILDFSEVHFMDSSGLALILGRYELCGKRKMGFSLAGVSPAIARLLSLSGIDRIVPSHTLSHS